VCKPGQLRNRSQPAWDLSNHLGASGSSTSWLERPTNGQGLAALGAALGQATIVYQNFTWRRIREICPTGTFSQADIDRIAAAGKARTTSGSCRPSSVQARPAI